MKNRSWLWGLLLMLGVGVVYAGLAQRHYFDALNYTLTVATAFWHGQLGVLDRPSWLSEMVLNNGWYYTVFPLGAVLVMMPFALPVAAGWAADYPVPLVLVVIAMATAALAWGVTRVRPELSLAKRLLLASWIPLASWFMPNLALDGAWQLALGWAVVGELGAIYFVLVRPKPWLAGLFLALGFGNRTEVLLAAPVLMWWMVRPRLVVYPWREALRRSWKQLVAFCVGPVALGVATLWYNWARFGSVTDFGYARINGILEEPWYQHGIFSVYAIPDNARVMLWHGWSIEGVWPYLTPDPFGVSIWWGSPFLLLLLWRWKRGRRWLVRPAVVVLGVLTLVLWLHGNTGGWQLSYRYAMVLMPWLLLLMIERLPEQVRRYEAALWVASCALNAWGLYLFFTTGMGYN